MPCNTLLTLNVYLVVASNTNHAECKCHTTTCLVHHFMDTWHLCLSPEKHAFILDDAMSNQAMSKPVASNINQALLICLRHSGSNYTFCIRRRYGSLFTSASICSQSPQGYSPKAASAPLQTSIFECLSGQGNRAEPGAQVLRPATYPVQKHN